MLFLGAGASKAVGIGDLKELTKNVKVRLMKKGYGNLIQQVISILGKANMRIRKKDNRFFNEGEIDIEVIFSVLNGLSNPIKALKDLGPYAIYINELSRKRESPLSKSLHKKDEMKRIKTLVGEVITSVCSKFNESDADKYYHELFDFQKDMIKANRGRLFSPTVTTNYDLVFERCAKKNSEMLANTGFQNTDGDRTLPVEKIIIEDRYQIDYLKLHGSINWWIRDSDKRIVERQEMQPGTSLMGDTYNEQLMIYPIYEKYVSEDPYFSLYYYFRRLLYWHDLYVVIGYSFRDQSINNAFADALRNKSNSRLIIVNSNKKNIESRINHYFSMDKVKIVGASFGDSELFTELRKVLL
jgi:hypothetical protein